MVAVTGSYFLLHYPWGPAPMSLAVAIVLATAARRRVLSWSVSGAVVGALLLVAVLRGGDLALVRASAVSAWLVIMVLVGEARAARMERAQERRARAQAARQRAEDEYRLTLARDIHDVVAHSLSMINVRASVALHLADRDPGQLKPALEAIKEGSKDVAGPGQGAAGRAAPGCARCSRASLWRVLPHLWRTPRGPGLAPVWRTTATPGCCAKAWVPRGRPWCTGWPRRP